MRSILQDVPRRDIEWPRAFSILAFMLLSFALTSHGQGIFVSAPDLPSTEPISQPHVTYNVSTPEEFQSALDAAQPGDTIMLAAGATLVGSFSLPAKSGSDIITITTSD